MAATSGALLKTLRLWVIYRRSTPVRTQGSGCQVPPQPAAVCARLCHAGQIRSMRSVHPVLSRRRLRSIAGLESSAAVSCSSSGPSKAAVS
jgi:hypothetical protein